MAKSRSTVRWVTDNVSDISLAVMFGLSLIIETIKRCLLDSSTFIRFPTFVSDTFPTFSREITHLHPPQDSHSLAPVFAILSVLGFIDDGRLQDFDRVPGVGWDDAAVTAGGRAQDIVLTKPWILRSLGEELRYELIPKYHQAQTPNSGTEDSSTVHCI